MDQVAAKHLGKETQLASLELSLDSNEHAGACDSGYSCAYTNTISWRDETTPMPMENDPRAVFERLFGAADSTDPAARQARLTQERSILDLALESVARLKTDLGRAGSAAHEPVPGRRPRDRAPHPGGRGAEPAGTAGLRSAGRGSPTPTRRIAG